MNEKNVNLTPELDEEELDKVAGGAAIALPNGASALPGRNVKLTLDVFEQDYKPVNELKPTTKSL